MKDIFCAILRVFGAPGVHWVCLLSYSFVILSDQLPVLCFVKINYLLRFKWFNHTCTTTTSKEVNMSKNLIQKFVALTGAALTLVACECGGEKEIQEVSVSTGPIPGSAEDFKTNVKDRVFFAFDKSSLTAADVAILTAQADWFKMFPQTTAMIEGHCDPRGSREYNLALGNRRAAAAKNELVRDGVSADRLKTISFGKDKPPVEGNTEEAWAQQRTAITVVN